MKRLTAFILFFLLPLAACTDPSDPLPSGITNEAPVLVWTVTPTVGAAPLEVTIDSRASHDDQEITQRLLRVDDAIPTPVEALHTVTLASAGTYTLRLEIRDGAGASSSATRTITVSEPAQPDVSVLASDPFTLTTFVDQVIGNAITVGNTGTVDLVVSLVSLPTPLTSSFEEQLLTPGDLVDVPVILTCGSEASSGSGVIVLATNDPDESSIEVAVSYECRAEPSPGSEYQVEVLYEGDGVTPERQAVFERAAARWARVITGDVPDVTVPTGIVQDQCGTVEEYEGEVDDLMIIANLSDIDGPNGVLAQAGTCLFRIEGSLPLVGVMTFDTADMDMMEADGTLENVVLHEMGHVIGISPGLWVHFGMFDQPYADVNACLSDTDPRLWSTNAVRENQALGEPGYVEIEDNQIPGTGCAHFEEDLYGHELMTGYASPYGMPLSRLTIGVLDDIGYEVNYEAADPYSIPRFLLPGLRARDGLHINEVLYPPRGAITPEGTFVPFE